MIQTVQITGNGYLVNGSMHVPNAPGNRHYHAVQEWIKQGNTPDPIPGPTPEEIQRNLAATLDRHIDSVAQAKGYDNRITASLRAANPKSKWYSEGIAFSEWMDNCYEVSLSILNEVKEGTREIPTETELLAELPEIVWP
jgi:hypothetical protein